MCARCSDLPVRQYRSLIMTALEVCNTNLTNGFTVRKQSK